MKHLLAFFLGSRVAVFVALVLALPAYFLLSFLVGCVILDYRGFWIENIFIGALPVIGLSFGSAYLFLAVRFLWRRAGEISERWK